MFRYEFVRVILTVLTAFGLAYCTGSNHPKPEVSELPDTLMLNFPDTTTFQLDSSRVLDSILGNSVRFGDSNIYKVSELAVQSGVFAKSTNNLGHTVNLEYSFVSPANDTLKKRPFVLFVHEGAFLFGSLENELGKAKSMAQKGYATASINYRLGVTGGTERNICSSNRSEMIRAIYRAVQDTYAALYYFTSHADTLGIDISQVFLAGSSAGAITITALAYTNEANFEALDPGIVKLLGKLDPYQTSKRFKLRAMLTSLGYGLLFGSNFSNTNAKPTVFFQRTGDDVLPYDAGFLFFCSGFPWSFGAKHVANQLEKFNIQYELHYEEDSGHLISYPESYISDRYALFIKRLWKQDQRNVIFENYTELSNSKKN